MSSKKRNRKVHNKRIHKKKVKNSKRKILIGISSILVIIVLICGGIYFINNKNPIDEVIKKKDRTMYLAGNTNEINLFELKVSNDEESGEEIKRLISEEKIVRGKKVLVKDETIKYEDNTYYLVKIDGNSYYINAINLVDKDREVVLEDKMYVRSATSIVSSNDGKILDLAAKGDELEIISYNNIDDLGNVDIYKVKKGDVEGNVYGKYMSYTKEESLLNYQPEVYDPIHSSIKNTYDGGDAIGLDFYPNERVEFDNNKMPDSVYALYLNCGSNVINNIDSYIEFAKGTKINAFVVDIKDNETPAYPAKVFESLSPTNFSHAINSYDAYKSAITKLKDNGFYVIGRITVFKDSYYVTDHPDAAILNKNTNQPYLHNGSYWPSVYNRDVWYYNVSLALEAVREFGFNEINFDYVRFPDRMNSVSGVVDLKNNYNESKAQAIQRFVQYAKDRLHEESTYISIDVFGETTNGSYTTAYGQYWPAISNEADVISGMPYPDHFSAGYYGLAKPWNEPYRLMNTWGRYASDRQKESPTPARVRTWIQAYDVMRYVDSNGIKYGAKEVEDEIRGLYDASLNGGYITWLSNSSLDKYRQQAQAFSIDYGKEYSERNG